MRSVIGTDNEELLNDPLYLGLRTPRLKGEEYSTLVEEFMLAVKFRFPNALVQVSRLEVDLSCTDWKYQFEDFSNENARVLLDQYRDQHLCFNDDIQARCVL